MTDAVLTIAAIFFVLAALIRLKDLRPGAPAGRRAVATAVWGLAIGSAVLTRPVETWLHETSQVPNVAEPVARTALMVGAVGAQSIFLMSAGDLDGRRWVRRRVVVLLVAVVGVWAAFAAAAVGQPSDALLVRYGGNPWIALMLTIYLVFFGWCFVDLLRAWKRLGPLTDGPLHQGLRLLAAGAATGCGYVLARLLGQAGVVFGWPVVVDITIVVCVLLGAITGFLSVAGVLWPSARERVDGLSAWWAAYRASRQLYPLWRGLVRVQPGIALEPVPGPLRERLRLRDVRWRLYRRVIEIRDGRRALRPYVRRVRALGLRDARAETMDGQAARIEGEALAQAVLTPRDEVGPADDAPVEVAPAPEGMAGEVAYLTEVSHHYTEALEAAGADSDGTRRTA